MSVLVKWTVSLGYARYEPKTRLHVSTRRTSRIILHYYWIALGCLTSPEWNERMPKNKQNINKQTLHAHAKDAISDFIPYTETERKNKTQTKRTELRYSCLAQQYYCHSLTTTT